MTGTNETSDIGLVDIRRLRSTRETLAYQNGGLFPIMVADDAGHLLAVVRAGAGHHGISRIELIRSMDQGLTWNAPLTVMDLEWDDGNKAFGRSADGTLLLVWQSRLAWDEHGWMGEDPARAAAAKSRVLISRSTDGGWTWEPPRPLGVPEVERGVPFGKIVDVGGRLLMVIYQSGPDSMGQLRAQNLVLQSEDDGLTWTARPLHMGFNETALVVLASGDVLAAMREDVDMALHQVRSTDGGATWSAPVQITQPREHPADYLQLSDEHLLLVFGRRHRPYRVEALSSHDGGATWSTKRIALSGPLAGFSGEERFFDFGYPSSALIDTPAGAVGVTMYYMQPDIRQLGSLSDLTNPLYFATGYRAVAVRWSKAELEAAIL